MLEWDLKFFKKVEAKLLTKDCNYSSISSEGKGGGEKLKIMGFERWRTMLLLKNKVK